MLDGLVVREKNNLRKFVISLLIYSTVFTLASVLLVEYVLPFNVGGMNLGGIVSVFIATLAVSYPLTDFMRSRDNEELNSRWSEPNIMRRHFEELYAYVAVFIAAAIGFGIASYFLSGDFFTIQSMILEGIRGEAAMTGQMTAGSSEMFYNILVNNLFVFLSTFAISFFISGGLAFIIIWNASVLGVLLGTLSSNIVQVPINLLPYIVHGTVEVAAYVFAGFGGYLLAYHIEHYLCEETHCEGCFKLVVRDVVALICLGVLFVFLGAVLETGYPFV